MKRNWRSVVALATLLLCAPSAWALTAEQVHGRVFVLVDGRGTVLAKEVRLRPGGVVEGLGRARGARWAISERIVVLLDAKGKPTCRFSRVRLSHGKLAMEGTPAGATKTSRWILEERGYKPPVKPKRFELTREDVMSRRFTFGLRSGKQLAKALRLRPKGKIGGYKALNAQRWDFIDGKVVFFDTKGKISVRFTAVRQRKGKLELMGAFQHNRKVTLVLREPGFGQ